MPGWHLQGHVRRLQAWKMGEESMVSDSVVTSEGFEWDEVVG